MIERSLEEIRAFFSKDVFGMVECGITIDEASVQGAVCSMPISDVCSNTSGSVHGGAMFTLADACFAAAANAGGGRVITQNAQINYLKPAFGSRLVARSKCLHFGRTTCLYEVSVYDENDKCVCFATMSGFRVEKSE